MSCCSPAGCRPCAMKKDPTQILHLRCRKCQWRWGFIIHKSQRLADSSIWHSITRQFACLSSGADWTLGSFRTSSSTTEPFWEIILLGLLLASAAHRLIVMSAGTLLRTEALSWMLDVGNVTGALSQGSLLQPAWDYLLRNHHELLKSPLFPVLLSISTYFCLIALYTALDLLAPTWPCINRHRLHPDKPITWPNVWTTLVLTIYNHLLYIFPAAVAQWLWRPPTPLPREAPTLCGFFLGIFGCTVVFDFQYYIWHLLHHRVPWLYRTFHATHHQYNQPFSLVTQYLSGWELFSVGFWATIDPILLQCHCLTTWGFMVFNVYVSTEDHCGYDFPWSMHRLVPFGLWGGAPKHDTHHQKPSTNFAPFFSHWDWLAGTQVGPSPPGCAATEETDEMRAKTKEL